MPDTADITALRDAADELSELHRQLGTQRSTRIRTYNNVLIPRIEQGDSISSATRYAEYACMEQDVELAIDEGKARALQVRVDALTTIINRG